MRPDAAINLLLRLHVSVGARVRRAWFNALGARITRGRLARIHIPRNPWDIELDDVALDDDVVLLTSGPRGGAPRIRIGPGTYVNRWTMFDASERIEVGAGVMIGPYCYITDHDHGIAPGSIPEQPLVGAPVSIGDGAWLGAGVTVLKGVTIGPGAVIGAGSVVSRDIGPNTIAVGAPARSIGARS